MTKAAAIVGILSLQVILAPEDGCWIAQAVELDYSAAGDSQEDAKQRFEAGLCATIQEHFKRFGNLRRLLVPAPTEDWLGLVDTEAQSQWSILVSTHRFVPPNLFPFKGITYLMAATEMAHAGS